MKVLSIVLWAAFTTIVVAVGAVLLPACGLLASLSTAVPGTGWNFCAPSLAASASTTSEALGRRAQELELEVARKTLACLTMSGSSRQPAAASAASPSRPTHPRQGAAVATSPTTEPIPAATLPARPPTAADPKVAASDSKPAEAPPGDYAFLKGCWLSDPFRHTSSEPMGLSTYCFDENGAGRLEYRRVDQPDYSCRLAVQANAQGEQLHLRDSDGRCSDGTPWYADNLECSRSAGEITECRGTSVTSNGKESFPLRLHRMK